MHSGLQAFGAQSLEEEVVMKLHCCCWSALFFYQAEACTFPGDGLFHAMKLACCGSCVPCPQRHVVAQPPPHGLGGGRAGTTATVCTSSSLILCFKPVTTALEFRGRIRFIYYFYLLLKPHFTSPLKQFLFRRRLSPALSHRGPLSCGV